VIPNHEDKYDAEALFSPADAVSSQGDGLPEIPPAIVLGYQEELTEAVRERAGPPIDLVRSQRVYPISDDVGYVPVHESGVGAPVSAIVTENAIAAGAEAVLMLGGCGALQTELPPDAAILPTETIRDEGVSHHYLPPEEPLRATASLVAVLEGHLNAAGFETPTGPTWTTSAMYRETVPEIRRYREEGVLSLCMESAAIWAVCRYRGADAATVHQIGDYLSQDEWVPEAESERGLPALLSPTVAALEEHVADG
jgi:uridine phosphorylase